VIKQRREADDERRKHEVPTLRGDASDHRVMEAGRNGVHRRKQITTRAEVLVAKSRARRMERQNSLSKEPFFKKEQQKR
jgi:hypothetical protein